MSRSEEAVHSCGCSHSCEIKPEETQAPASKSALPSDKPVFSIPAMDCINEEKEIRAMLADLPGIKALKFDLSARHLMIDAKGATLDTALERIRRGGFKATPVQDIQTGSSAIGSVAQNESVRYGAALLLALSAEMAHWFGASNHWIYGAGMLAALAAIALAGWSTYTKGLAAIRHFKLNINALMTVAVTGAFAIGQWPEAAMVMALYALAELIEARSVERARNAIEGLLAISPETALIQSNGQWIEVPVGEVKPGSIIRILPGARVPLDGVIQTGSTSLNESAVTGESIPVDKASGEGVFAGTVNLSAVLEVEVTATSAGTLLARIIEAVQKAQATRAPTEKLVDRFAAWYTPAVFGIAVLVAVLPPLVFNWTWMEAVYKSLVLLVIACPCALVISTPVTVVSALARAAREGILFKGGVFLELARKLRVIAFDKTGTLTLGKPQLQSSNSLSDFQPERVIHAWAHALAAQSDHPVSQAITLGLAQQASPLLPVLEVKALPGLGVQGRIEGHMVYLGNSRLLQKLGLNTTGHEPLLGELQNSGCSVSFLANDEEVLAVYAVRDQVRPESKEAVAALQKRGIQVAMLTGDTPTTANYVSSELNINSVFAGLMPDEKLSILENLQTRFGQTGMCGDGLNDAPALARADLGFAMGGAGTDVAMEAADVVIMNDSPLKVVRSLELSDRARIVLWQNIAIALGIKLVFLGLAVFGTATMWEAVFADMGASLLVVFNGLRLLR